MPKPALASKMTSKRKVFAVTAARSDYDLLLPVMQTLQAREFDARFIACAAQLSPFHGRGYENIAADGFEVAGSIESLLSSESLSARALSCANVLEGLARLLSVDPPDILLIAGDREEALATAMVGNFLGIHTAHLFGGDRCIASDIDEVFRPAISKLAHIHFTATEGHRLRLVEMGERSETVYAVGATGLDTLRRTEEVPASVLNERWGVDVAKPFFILIQHPSPLLDSGKGGLEMSEILEGVLSLGHPVFCSYPNCDPGNIALRNAIDEAQQRHPQLKVYNNLPRGDFVSLYRRCAAIIGNSSSIVIESGFLRVPGILIGPRQNLREISDNVIRVEISRNAVRDACEAALTDERFMQRARSCNSIYGDGFASERIGDILEQIVLSVDLLRKTIAY